VQKGGHSELSDFVQGDDVAVLIEVFVVQCMGEPISLIKNPKAVFESRVGSRRIGQIGEPGLVEPPEALEQRRID
jgi:hypothetical protein